VNLLQNNGDTDARQHGVYHDRRNPQRGASHLNHPEQDLQRTRAHRDHAGHLPTEIIDQSGDHHSETRGRPADLKRRPANGAGDNAAHHRGDQTGHQRSPGCDGDSQRKRQRNKKDDQRGGKVVSQIAQQCPGSKAHRLILDGQRMSR
jgi:hypothetical protein